jgi:hypothetical protein
MPEPKTKTWEPVVRRSLLLAVVLGMALAFALSLASLADDPDSWWHLRTGQWIVQHLAVPDRELFALHPAHERWVAYSWAYDVLLYGLHRAFGLFGPVVLAAGLAVVIALTLYLVLRALSGRAALSALLAGAGVVAIAPMLYGRSTMLTIELALLEIHLLSQAVLLGRRACLYAVPLVIAVWANVHVQFVYGLLVYAGFLAEAAIERREPGFLRAMLLAGAACLAATLANPYGLRIYEPFAQYVAQSGTIYGLLQELHPPGFRTLPDWTALAIVAAVAVSAFRRRPRAPALLLLFAAAAAIAFRSARDVWFLAAVGLPMLAWIHRRTGEREPERASPLLVALGTAAAGALAAAALGISSTSLDDAIARRYPVRAAEHVEAQGCEGRLFNPYDWGGWLMWRWPDRKVSIDGRTYVHGAAALERSFRTWNAMPGWERDEDLGAAGIVLGGSDQPLMTALEGDPRFRRVYRDDVACVFVRVTR